MQFSQAIHRLKLPAALTHLPSSKYLNFAHIPTKWKVNYSIWRLEGAQKKARKGHLGILMKNLKHRRFSFPRSFYFPTVPPPASRPRHGSSARHFDIGVGDDVDSKLVWAPGMMRIGVPFAGRLGFKRAANMLEFKSSCSIPFLIKQYDWFRFLAVFVIRHGLD